MSASARPTVASRAARAIRFIAREFVRVEAQRRAGGEVGGSAHDMAWGHRVAHVTDPDGSPINLTQQL